MPAPLAVHTTSAPLLESAADVLMLPIRQDGALTENAAAADALLDGLLTDMRDRREFRGEAYQVAVIPTLGRLRAPRLALVGLGKEAEGTLNTCRLAMAAASRAVGKRGLPRAAVDVADWPFPADEVAVVLAEGAELSRYAADPYRTTERRDVALAELEVAGASEAALREGAIRGRARNLARELVNEPGNKLDPPELASRAAALAADVGLECQILDEAHMENLEMGAILAVTRGSEVPARFIVLRHEGGPEKNGAPLLALVGKAVTFDTGGISIKPSAEMGRMKGDMAGGAAVIAAMGAIAELGLPVNVIGLVPAAVNMPDGRAWKPGDVITAMSGATIETVTTDAEGRMLLADAVTYARTLGATHIVDIATLTGACVVALGHVASGLYGTDDALVEAVRAGGEAAGERHWPMPLFREYRELIRSEIGDLKNSGGRAAGSVTAAWFIREFAKDTPWAHLDIAGTSSYEKPRPWAPAGPTGTGVGTFINLARWFAEQQQ
ncbi:MAG TPA: leucyl aminopeptidase [Armatimonadota bacterium]|nr:leucyl aminopeptidase [Armatimonadota bacterium]